MRQTKRLQGGLGVSLSAQQRGIFGLGDVQGPVKASIRWPSGMVQKFLDLPVNHRVWMEEGAAAPSRLEPFRTAPHPAKQSVDAKPDVVPSRIGTWLLSPIAAPSGKGPSVVTFAPDVQAPEDMAAVYNILYRYIFDWHRDLSLPSSFLIDDSGHIVKIYRGPVEPHEIEEDQRHIPRTAAERLQKALPFSGVAATYEYGRNHLTLGSVFFQRGYYDESAVYFEFALRDDPSSAEAQYGLGSVYLKKNQARKARESFEQAAKLSPAYPETKPNAWNNLGLLDTQEGRTRDAVACFEEAVRLSPNHAIALLNLRKRLQVGEALG